MLEMYRQQLESQGCFVHEYAPIIKAGMATIPGNVPEKMKALMITTELLVFASHLRKPIMWEKATIPVNAISFILAGSGVGKDSSMNMIRRAMIPAHEKIDKYREAHAKAQAVEDAETDGKKPGDWRKYYSKPRDLNSGIGTLPGQMKHLAKLEAGKLGAGYIQVSEIGSELQGNKDIAENIVALAVGYDAGFIPAKTLKDDSQQTDAIKNLPFSGLLFGSPAGITMDPVVKAKFIEEFSTKLSRRSTVYFSNDKVERQKFESIPEAHAHAKAIKEASFKAMEQLEPWLTDLVDYTTHIPLEVEDVVYELFDDYKGYNEWYSDLMTKQHPMSILHRQHMQWKALKLSGALAILNNETIITKDNYVHAINFCEIFATDLEEFEVELAKEPYELFSDYMVSIAEGGMASIEIHKLRKMGFVRGNGSTQNKLIELVELAKSYDNDNKYEVAPNGYIHFYEGALTDEAERDELA